MNELKLDMHAHVCVWVCVYNMKEGQKRRKTKSQTALCLRKNQRNLVIHLHEQHVRRETNITDTDIHIHLFSICHWNTVSSEHGVRVGLCVYRSVCLGSISHRAEFRTLRLRKQTSHLYERGSLRKEHTHTHTHLQHTDQISKYIHANYTNTH